MAERPTLIQEWLDGEISTEDAVLIAYASRNIRLTVWADIIVSSWVLRPGDIFKVVSCV